MLSRLSSVSNAPLYKTLALAAQPQARQHQAISPLFGQNNQDAVILQPKSRPLHFGIAELAAKNTISPLLMGIPKFFPEIMENMIDTIGRDGVSRISKKPISDYDATKRGEVNQFNLTIGAPIDLPPPYFVERKIHHLEEGLSNPKLLLHVYSPILGMPQYLNAARGYLAQRFKLDHARVTNPEKFGMMALQGSNQGILFLLQSVLDKPTTDGTTKDIVLLPTLSYPTFTNGAKMGGFNPIQVPFVQNTFLPDYLGYIQQQSLSDRNFAQKIRAIVINFPANPNGHYVDMNYLKPLVEFCKTNGIVLISDMAYAENYLPGATEKPHSIFEVEGAEKIGVEFHSLSKSFNLTGDRVAFVAGNPLLVQWMGTYKAFLDASNIPRYIQLAAADFLSNTPVDGKNVPQIRETFLSNMREEYQRRQNAILEGLADVGWLPKAATTQDQTPAMPFYQWVKVPQQYKPQSAKPSEPIDMTFVRELLEETGVGMIYGSAFGTAGEGYVRIAATQPIETINNAFKAIEGSRFNYASKA